MPEPSGLTIAGIVGGAVTLCGAIGGAIRWLINRRDNREDAHVKKIEARIEALESETRVLESETRRLWLVIGYVVPALHAADPLSPALKAAQQILGNRFPLDPNIPGDMQSLLDRMP